jgi:hypothetical protein
MSDVQVQDGVIKIARKHVSAEDFALKYDEVYKTGNGTIEQVAEALGITTANAYQKYRLLNEKLRESGLDIQLPKMKMTTKARKASNKLDITRLSTIVAGMSARQALDDLD